MDEVNAAVIADTSARAQASERLTKLAQEADALAITLPRSLAKSRLQTVRNLATEVANCSMALRLSMKLNRPTDDASAVAEELKASVAKLRHLTARMRIDQGTFLTIALLDKLVTQLFAELSSSAS